MTTWNTQPVRRSPGSHDDMDRDLLVSRLAEDRAGDAEWSALRALASADPSVWTDVQLAARQARALERALEPAALAAQRLPMPTLSVDLPARTDVIGRIGIGSARATLGWLVAAAVALGWGSQWLTPLTGPAANTASLAPVIRTPDAALNEYLDLGKKAGRVVAEMPERIVLESRPAPDGNGYEVLYVRQVLERATVGPDDLYKLGIKEDGRTTLVPAGSPPAPRSGPPAM